MKIVTATINDADFLPSYGIQDSIIILWAKPEAGNEIIVETFGSKKSLAKKFDFMYEGREQWDLRPLIQRKCALEISDSEVRFLKYL